MEIKGKLKIQNGAAPGFQKLIIVSELLASNPNLVFNVQGSFEGEGEFVLTLPEKKAEEPGKTPHNEPKPKGKKLKVEEPA
jgi:hypothetical protein